MTVDSADQLPCYAVKVTQHEVDLSDQVTSTGEALLRVLGNPGCFYMNPRFLVSADLPTPEFFRAARRAQRQWCRTMSQSLGSSLRRRRAKELEPIERMLRHTGVLLINGVPICPKHWESLKPWNPSPRLGEPSGERFIDREPPHWPSPDKKDELTK
jgi:hypothetical protein